MMFKMMRLTFNLRLAFGAITLALFTMLAIPNVQAEETFDNVEADKWHQLGAIAFTKNRSNQLFILICTEPAVAYVSQGDQSLLNQLGDFSSVPFAFASKGLDTPIEDYAVTRLTGDGFGLSMSPRTIGYMRDHALMLVEIKQQGLAFSLKGSSAAINGCFAQ